MVMTDPIADYLTRIRNANMAKHSSVEIPASSMKKSLSEILKNEGFIRDYQVEDDNKQGMIKIFLKYGLIFDTRTSLCSYICACAVFGKVAASVTPPLSGSIFSVEI